MRKLLIVLSLLFSSKTVFAPSPLFLRELYERDEEKLRKETEQKAFAELVPMMAQAHKMSTALAGMQACAYANPLGNQLMLAKQQALAVQMEKLNNYVRKAAGITDAKPETAAAADAKQNAEENS